MAKLWRIGIVGCGWAGERHALALKPLSERASIVALADARAEVAQKKAHEWQVSYWTSDYRELLSGGRLDAVSICLPHHLHATASIDAAKAGLHVLVEKPLARTLEEADRMIFAAEKAGTILMVAKNVRFEAPYRKAAEIVRSGALGNVFLIRVSREHEMHDYLRARPWFLSEPSGGIMYSVARAGRLTPPHLHPRSSARDAAS